MIRKTALLVAATLAAAPAQATVLYAYNQANTLFSFDSSNPGRFLSTTPVLGLDSQLEGIDFRPLTGMLFGYTDGNRLYSIDLATGLATGIGGANLLADTNFGFDFNPTIDRIRLVGDTNTNSVLNPDTGAFMATTPVFYAAGDANEGRDPDITANGYTPSTFGAVGTSTQLFSIDSRNDLLARQANSAGTLNTVGALGVDFGPDNGFDIAVDGMAFALNGQDLYSVNLSTGRLSSLGRTLVPLSGLAAAVPEPSSWGFLLLGAGAMGFAFRRRLPRRVAYAG